LMRAAFDFALNYARRQLHAILKRPEYDPLTASAEVEI